MLKDYICVLKERDRYEMNRLIFSIFLFPVLLFHACAQKQELEHVPAKPDYSSPSSWYVVSDDSAKADIFYVTPTCVWDWSDENGFLYHHADISNIEQREAIRPSLELADAIFGGEASFYAPYYRQITLESWMEGEAMVEKRFPLAMSDVLDAFHYYMDHFNNGRPFVLAGFSQGAKAVVELLKVMDKEAYERMVAAYVIGYKVTEQDLTYAYIRPAKDSVDVGVAVCYNSVEKVEAIAPVLSPSAVCINPLNWSNDTITAYLNDTVTVKKDDRHQVLLVDGFSSADLFLPQLADLFVQGNYHLYELTFYQDCLSHNIAQRIQAFYGKK